MAGNKKETGSSKPSTTGNRVRSAQPLTSAGASKKPPTTGSGGGGNKPNKK